MGTLRGDGSGQVVEIGLTVSQPWRCVYIDKNGRRCSNAREPGSKYCAICGELIKLTGKSGQDTDLPAIT